MKKTILLLVILVIIPSVIALHGGETWLYHFDECDELRVNVTGDTTIDKGEYTIHNGCDETGENYWECDCYDDFDLNVSFEINAVNDYKFEFNYDYTKEVIEDDDSSDGGGGGSSGGSGTVIYNKLCGNVSEKTIRICLTQGQGYNLTSGHLIILNKLYYNRVVVTLSSEPQTATIYLGQSKAFNLDTKMMNVTLDGIKGGTAILLVEDVVKDVVEEPIEIIEDEKITDTAEKGEETISIPPTTPIGTQPIKLSNWKVVIALLFIILAIILLAGLIIWGVILITRYIKKRNGGN